MSRSTFQAAFKLLGQECLSSLQHCRFALLKFRGARIRARGVRRFRRSCWRWAGSRSRDSKGLLSPEQVLERHRNLAAQYGRQADRVVAEARERGQRHVHEPALNRSTVAAQQAVTYARDHLFERSAGPERTWAARYEFNDVVRYARASKETGMERGEYARIKSVDAGEKPVDDH